MISVPVPPHFWHGCEMENRPCDSASTPRPWQRLHTLGVVPGLAPVPWQVGQGADMDTLTGTCAPSMAWSNETWTSVSRSAPRSGREAGPPRPAGPPPPNRSERMSPMPPPKPPPGCWPVRNEPGSKPLPKIPPPESYSRRFGGSDRIPYAVWISLKRSSALASPGLWSGWYSRASLR